MTEQRIPTPPRVGFSILANGIIQRGEPGTFTEENISAWYQRWQVMKRLGYFNDALPVADSAAPTSSGSSSWTNEVPVDFYVGLQDDDPKKTKEIKDGDGEKHQMPKDPACNQKKTKKDKKKSRK